MNTYRNWMIFISILTLPLNHGELHLQFVYRSLLFIHQMHCLVQPDPCPAMLLHCSVLLYFCLNYEEEEMIEDVSY